MNNEDAIRNQQPNTQQNKQRKNDSSKSKAKKELERREKKFIYSLVRKGATSIFRSIITFPVAWVVIPFIAITLYLLIFESGGGSALNTGIDPEPTPLPGGGAPSQPPIDGFTLTLTGPESVENGSLIGYTISYAYDETAASVPLDSITIYDDLPSSVAFTRASGDYNQSGSTISWPLEGEPNQGQMNITLRPTREDIVVINKVYARTSATQDPENTETVPPNNNTCDGKYSFNNPLGNFGDPDCNFSKDQLYTLLQSIDPQNAHFWYYKIVPCESGYIPLAYNPNAVDPAGAWGLFQMGRGRNGQYDHGDVNWQKQASNAVNYNGRINGSFAYWECAR